MWFWQAWLRAILAGLVPMMAVVLGTNVSSDAHAAGPRAPTATCVWTGSTSIAWDNNGNWSGTCTGTGGIPGSGDDVSLPSGTLNYEPTISAADVSINSLTIESGRTLTLSSNKNLTVAGALTINSGGILTSSGSSSTITVGGNWTNGGTFTGGTSTVVFSGTLTISSSGTSHFYHLTLNPGSNNTVSIAANHTIYVAGDWTRSSGSFERNTSTVVFDGSGTSTLTSSSAITFHNLTIGSGKTLSLTYYGTIFYIENTLSLSDASSTFETNGRPVAFSNSSYAAVLAGAGTFNFGKLTINSGKTLDAGSTSINVSGDWVNNGTFTADISIVTFNGSSAQAISGATDFYNLTINNTATIPGDDADVDPDVAVTVANTLNVNDGQFQPPTGSSFSDVTIGSTGILKPDSGASISVSDSWTNNGTFTHNNGTMNFCMTTMSGGSTTSLYNLVTDTGCVLTLPSGNLNVAGNWTDNGSGFHHNNGTVTFNGSSDQTISSAGGTQAFNNLTVNKSSGTLSVGSLPSVIQVEGNFTLSSGTFNAPVRLTVFGNWTNNGTFNHNNGEVSFVSTATISGSSTNSFNDLGISSSGNLTAPSANMNVAGNLTNWGTFNHNNGTVTFDGTTTISGWGTHSFNNVTISSGSSLTAPYSYDMNVAGNWTNNGTFNHNNWRVIFNGSGTQTFTGSTTFNNVTVNAGSTLQLAANANFGYAGTFTLNGSFDATTNSPTTVTIAGTSAQTLPANATTLRNLTINSGASLTAPSSLSIAGDFTNNGTFTHNNGTVTFNGSGTSNYGGSSTTTFYNLQINSGAILDVGTNTLFNAINSLRNQGKLKQTQTIGTGNVAFLNVTAGTYYGLEIDPEGSTSMGSTTVTIYGEQTCPSPPSLGVTPIKRCYDIAPTTQTAATVKFWFNDANELNGNVAGSVKIYHQKGGLWHSEPGTHSYGLAGGFDWVQVTGVDEYSPFAGTSNTPSAPTLIELTSFTSTALDGYVLVEWETASEIDNAGFNLWRSESEAGPYTRLNTDLIPARGAPTFGARYSYLDAVVPPGVTYWYKLEDLDLFGISTMHGPVAASTRTRRLFNVYLPLILKR